MANRWERHGQPWTPDEDRRVLEAAPGRGRGHVLRSLAAELGRTRAAVVGRRVELRRRAAAQERIAEVRSRQADGQPPSYAEMVAVVQEAVQHHEARLQAAVCLAGCGEAAEPGHDGYCNEHGPGW